MKRGLSVLLLAACGIEAPGQIAEDLYGRATVLWPLVDGRATVHVCWRSANLGDETFPVAAYAPDLAATLAERKAWARAIAESQWNALTPLELVGWGDCDATPVDVELEPISSAVVTNCGGEGQPCADALGTDLRHGGAVHLNLLFGDERLYASRYEQSTADGGYAPANDVRKSWIPQACLRELAGPWTTSDHPPRIDVDIFNPGILASFMNIYQTCLQYSVLHELGHAAGLAHEQYRPDDTARRAACYAYERSIGIGDVQPSDVSPRYRGTRTLGPFDSESIMSYCRQDQSATLSPEDVQLLPVLYGLAPDPYPEDGGGCSAAGGARSQVTGWLPVALVLVFLRRRSQTPRKRRFPKFRSSSAA